ncbi:V-type ATP synthase subunit I [Marinospirillum insulare]|uniref:V-type ATP synthase subunit I n=1 Tax=Marinospirillum insulare TaxID=217169 RepID=A0ABQ5ZY06_9GAMM|nr:ATP synthase [Marinospirillum insulare]GLR63541.1 V-type ATP synthase subunit I [Marinospirillum insulare]
MSILQLKKASLIGLTENKMHTLDKLQKLGLMHIIPLQELSSQRIEEDEEVNPELLKRSLQYLLSCPNKRRQVTQEKQFNLKKVISAVEKNHSERLSLLEERDFLEKRIKDLEPWGDFVLPDLNDLNQQRFWFYLVPNFKMKEVEALSLPWTVVHQGNRNSYLVVVSPEEPAANLLPVARTHTGYIPISQLREKLEEAEIALEATEAEREALTRWTYLLQRSIASTADASLLSEVANQSLDFDEVFALQGWLAERDLDQLQMFAEQQGLVLLTEDPEDEELPPTYMDNSERVGGGQEVVSFFQTPGYRSWDPSRVVFFSFVSFFAIIMSDAGYSLILGGIIAYYWKAMSRTETHRRLRAMGAALAGAGFIWGVMVGGYFGASAPLPFLGSLKVLDVNDFDTMMTLSICIGAAHLILGNLMMAWVRRKSTQALSSVGWALAVFVALLGWIFGFSNLYWGVFAAGLVMVLLFSGEKTNVSLATLVAGLLALTNLTKIFGDVLSYLRLFALGLASASLALTFNQLAADVGAALPGIGLLLQVLILIIGHLLNFVLTVVSGVIHGLRLNLIEFYNWSLADEGYPFQPFAKQEVIPWTT